MYRYVHIIEVSDETSCRRWTSGDGVMGQASIIVAENASESFTKATSALTWAFSLLWCRNSLVHFCPVPSKRHSFSLLLTIWWTGKKKIFFIFAVLCRKVLGRRNFGCRFTHLIFPSHSMKQIKKIFRLSTCWTNFFITLSLRKKC